MLKEPDMVIRAGIPREVAGDGLLQRMNENQLGEEGGRVGSTKAQDRRDSMCKEPGVVGTEDAQGAGTGDRWCPVSKIC